MIDDNKIEEAANLHRFELIASMHGSTLGTPMQCFKEVVDAETELIENSFITGAKWAINEFLKNLFHPAEDIPEEGRPVLVAYTHGGYSIEYWKAYNFSGQVNHWTLDITQWIYVDDLLPKEGGEK